METNSSLKYKEEMKLNYELLKSAMRNFNSFIVCEDNKETLSRFKVRTSEQEGPSFFIPYRVRDLLIASTDDMCRYALYHDIGYNAEGLLDISPAARAAFFTKWVIRLRPCILDIAEDARYSSVSIENDGVAFEEHQIVFCNEHFAACIASAALNIPSEQNPEEAIYIPEIFENKELKTFLYHLRYRIPHQDTLTLLFNRLKTQEALGQI